MSDHNVTAIAAISDDNAVHRLFDIMANGNQDTQELAQLDALIYERLARAYDDTGVAPAQLHAVRAA